MILDLNTQLNPIDALTLDSKIIGGISENLEPEIQPRESVWALIFRIRSDQH